MNGRLWILRKYLEWMQMVLGKKVFYLTMQSLIFECEKVPHHKEGSPFRVTSRAWNINGSGAGQLLWWRWEAERNHSHFKETLAKQRKKESTYNSWHQSIAVEEMDSHSGGQEQSWRVFFILSLHQNAMAIQSMNYILRVACNVNNFCVPQGWKPAVRPLWQHHWGQSLFANSK